MRDLITDFPREWAPDFMPELDHRSSPTLMTMAPRPRWRRSPPRALHLPKRRPAYKLLVGPIKKSARIAVKVQEYEDENGGALEKGLYIRSVTCRVMIIARTATA